MRLSETGLEFIKRWEGFRATPYDDGYGFLTIGYGHRIRPGEKFTRLSEAEALELLRQDIGWAEAAVNQLVRVPLNQSQFDALVSLVFNWGEPNFSKSVLLARLNAGDYEGAAQRLSEHPVTSGGKFSAGLQRRRQAEAELFRAGGLPAANPTRPLRRRTPWGR